MANRIPRTLALAALTLFLEAACGGARPPSGVTQVVFWNTDTEKIAAGSISQIVDAFNRQTPDVHIKLVDVPLTDSTDTAKLTTAVRGGTAPDVFLENRPYVAERASAGLLEDLSPFLAGEKTDLKSQFLDFSWQDVVYQGHPYGLPFSSDTRALYYRKDVLRQAGVDPSQLDPSRGPISLDRLTQIAARLDQKDRTGAYTRLGFLPFFDQGTYLTWVLSYRGQLYNSAACRVTPTDPGVVSAFQFLYDYSKERDPQKIQAFVGSYASANLPPAESPFMTGHLAMIVSGNWLGASIRQYAPGADWGVTYLPVAAGSTPTTWSGGWSLVIPKGARQRSAAYRFMRYMTGPDGERTFVGSGHLPVWKGLLADSSLYPGAATFFKDLLPYSHSRPALPVNALYQDALKTAQDEVVLNQAAPQAVLSAVFGRVQPQLQAFCPLRT